MTKISLGILAMCAAGAFLCAGCASSKKETMVESTHPTETRSYTQSQLKKTGRTETNRALEEVDPAVQSSHH